jgi:hypothetical protein
MIQGSGFRVQGSGFRVHDSGFRVQGSGFRVQGSGFRVQGSGFRVQGSGFVCSECSRPASLVSVRVLVFGIWSKGSSIRRFTSMARQA